MRPLVCTWIYSWIVFCMYDYACMHVHPMLKAALMNVSPAGSVASQPVPGNRAPTRSWCPYVAKYCSNTRTIIAMDATCKCSHLVVHMICRSCLKCIAVFCLVGTDDVISYTCILKSHWSALRLYGSMLFVNVVNRIMSAGYWLASIALTCLLLSNP